MRHGIISSCQSAATSEIVKRCCSSLISSAITSSQTFTFTLIDWNDATHQQVYIKLVVMVDLSSTQKGRMKWMFNVTCWINCLKTGDGLRPTSFGSRQNVCVWLSLCVRCVHPCMHPETLLTWCHIKYTIYLHWHGWFMFWGQRVKGQGNNGIQCAGNSTFSAW